MMVARSFTGVATTACSFQGAGTFRGGHLEPGEAPLEALAREVHEETGWQDETGGNEH